MLFITFIVSCAFLIFANSNPITMEASSRILLQDLVNHFSQAATLPEMIMVSSTNIEENSVSNTEKTSRRLTNLRTTDSSGFLQYVLYSDSACSSMLGVVDIAIDVCVPYTNAVLGSNYILISKSQTNIVISGYSDAACSATIGSISVDESTGASCIVTESGTSNHFSVSSSTTIPTPPFPADTSYLTANIYASGCDSAVVVSVQAPEPPSRSCVIAKPGCVSIPASAIHKVNVPTHGYGACEVIPPQQSSVTVIGLNGNAGGTSGPGSCFAGSETVTMASGETRVIADVKLGDEIAVASMDGAFAGYSPVIAVPHASNSVKTTFSQITTVSGRDIKMTPEHLVLGGACAAPSLVQAGSLKASECVQTVSGAEVIASVATVSAEGIYSVVTKHDGLLIVNGIVASPFAVNHLVANSFYGVIRMMYSLFPALAKSSIIRQSFESFGALVVNNMS